MEITSQNFWNFLEINLPPPPENPTLPITALYILYVTLRKGFIQKESNDSFWLDYMNDESFWLNYMNKHCSFN